MGYTREAPPLCRVTWGQTCCWGTQAHMAVAVEVSPHIVGWALLETLQGGQGG